MNTQSKPGWFKTPVEMEFTRYEEVMKDVRIAKWVDEIEDFNTLHGYDRPMDWNYTFSMVGYDKLKILYLVQNMFFKTILDHDTKCEEEHIDPIDDEEELNWEGLCHQKSVKLHKARLGLVH